MNRAPLHTDIPNPHLPLLATVQDHPDPARQHDAKVHGHRAMHEVHAILVPGFGRHRRKVHDPTRHAAFVGDRDLLAVQVDEGLRDGGVGKSGSFADGGEAWDQARGRGAVGYQGVEGGEVGVGFDNGEAVGVVSWG